MESKVYGGSNWLGYQLQKLKEQEHAGPVFTAVVVVLLTYVLYTVSCPSVTFRDSPCWHVNGHGLIISTDYVCYRHPSHQGHARNPWGYSRVWTSSQAR